MSNRYAEFLILVGVSLGITIIFAIVLNRDIGGAISWGLGSGLAFGLLRILARREMEKRK